MGAFRAFSAWRRLGFSASRGVDAQLDRHSPSIGSWPVNVMGPVQGSPDKSYKIRPRTLLRTAVLDGRNSKPLACAELLFACVSLRSI